MDAKILGALMSMKPYKALGPDGLLARFFQRFWMVIGNSVKNEIKSIFSNGVIPNYLSHTLVSLIPKYNEPETFNQYRPISLCNTMYKLVTKILVLRICENYDP